MAPLIEFIATWKADTRMADPRLEAALQAAAEGKTVREIAASAGVSVDTFYKMLDNDKSALEAYAQAKDRGFDSLADDLLLIPHQETDMAKARILCDNIKWILARRKPQVYGDKIQMDISGSVDLTAIMAESAKRLRPMCDPGNVIEGELVTKSIPSDTRPTDKQSVSADAGLRDLLE